MWLAGGIFLTMNRAFLRMAFPFLLTFATLAAPSAALPLKLGAEWVWQRPSGGRLTLQVRDSLHVGSSVRWILVQQVESVTDRVLVTILQDSSGVQSWETRSSVIPWPPQDWSKAKRFWWNGTITGPEISKDPWGDSQVVMKGIGTRMIMPEWIDSLGPVLVPGWGVMISRNGRPVPAVLPDRRRITEVGRKWSWEIWDRTCDGRSCLGRLGASGGTTYSKSLSLALDTTSYFNANPSTTNSLSYLALEIEDRLDDSLGWVRLKVRTSHDGGPAAESSVRYLPGLVVAGLEQSSLLEGAERLPGEPGTGGFERRYDTAGYDLGVLESNRFDSSGALACRFSIKLSHLATNRGRREYVGFRLINLLSVDGVAVRDSFPMPAAVHRSAPSPKALIDLCQAWPEARLAVLDLQGRRTIVRGADLAADLRARGTQVRVVDGLFPDGTRWRGSILLP